MWCIGRRAIGLTAVSSKSVWQPHPCDAEDAVRVAGERPAADKCIHVLQKRRV